MKRVTGLGGVFFTCEEKESTRLWYQKHLGIESESYGFMFPWREHQAPHKVGYTVWSPFARDTNYFAPGEQSFMLNYRVEDLEALLPLLREEGVELIGEMEQHENGKFAWVMDPEGRKVELWEPVPSDEDPYLPGEG